MQYQIYAEYDVELIRISPDIYLISMEDEKTLRYFVVLDNIEQLVTQNFYNNILLLGKYPVEVGKMYKAMTSDGGTETIFDTHPV